MQPRFPRYSMQLPVLHKPKSPPPAKAGIGWTRNVGEQGTCVELAEVLKPSMPVWLYLHTDRGTIEAEARVVWGRELLQGEGGILHGFTFTRVSPSHLTILADMLLFKRKMRDDGVRLPLDLPVTCEPSGSTKPVNGRTINLSRGGVLIHLPPRLPVKTVLRLTLHAPTGPLDGEGLVVWTEALEKSRPGALIPHGLRFTYLSWSCPLTLGHLLMAPSLMMTP